ncbi:MAG: MFS transporter [Pseudomonadota bacterium]
MANIALLMVVVLDVMGQGLLFPIINNLMMDPSQGFLPHDTPTNMRQFGYGLVIGTFFLFWFLGAAYISKVSDYIGRKQGIMICLSGALAGYLLTIIALLTSSLILLLIGRAVSGFTAGNQPIAQAALVDISENDEQRTRYMGLIIVAMAIGLVIGPVIGGVLSDQGLIGSIASLELPFYVACALIVINIVLIAIYFHNMNFTPRKLKFRPVEIFLTLWQAAHRPNVARVSLVFFFQQSGIVSFYVFMDNYFFSRFHFDIFQNSLSMLVLGATMAVFSGFLVGPINKRVRKTSIVFAGIAIMALAEVVFILNQSPILAYFTIVPLIAAFGIVYPTTLTLFSACVDETEQGWVMGVAVALFTLASGIISILGGSLMAIDIRLPFFVSIGSFLVALVLIAVLWRRDDIQQLNAG